MKYLLTIALSETVGMFICPYKIHYLSQIHVISKHIIRIGFTINH